MKKTLKLMGLFLMTFGLFFNVVNAEKAVTAEKTEEKEKMSVYIFRGSGCSHCYDALTYFNSLGSIYDDVFEVKTYEVWNNKDNSALAKAVASKLQTEFSGVPFIVVGDQYFSGFGESTGESILSLVSDYVSNGKYKDVVASVVKSTKSNAVITSLKEACVEEGIVEEEAEDTESNDALAIILIFAVVFGGLGLLIFSSKSKTK